MSNDWTSPSGDRGAPHAGGPGHGPATGPPADRSYPPYPSQPPYDQQAPSYGQAPPPYDQQGPYGQAPPPYGQQGPYGQAPPPYGQQGPVPPGAWVPPMAARPGVVPLRPLTLGDVFEGSMRTIRGNPGATLGLALLVNLVFTLPAILLVLGLNELDPGDNGVVREVAFSLSQQGSTVLSLLAGIALSGMLTVVLADAVLGRRLSIGGAWDRVKGRLLALIGVNLLVVLALVGMIAVVVLLAVGLGVGIHPGVGVAVGVPLGFASVGLAIFLWVRWMFASASVVLEKQSPVTALKRSWALTRDQWWRVFGITLLTNIVVGFLSGIVTIPFALALAYATVSDPEAAPSLGFVIGLQLVGLVVNTLTSPFLANVTGLLYLDQRIRKEALDVSLMAAAQQQPAT